MVITVLTLMVMFSMMLRSVGVCGRFCLVILLVRKSVPLLYFVLFPVRACIFLVFSVSGRRESARARVRLFHPLVVAVQENKR